MWTLSPLINLASPEGVITLISFFGGIVLFTFVGLGGVGSRDLPEAFKIVLGIIVIAITVFGCIGMMLVTYPAISPGIQGIQNDFSSPTVVPTPRIESDTIATSAPQVIEESSITPFELNWISCATLLVIVAVGYVLSLLLEKASLKE